MNRTEIVNHFLLNSKTSLTELSKLISVNRSNIYLWKDGKTNPKSVYINKMADALGFNIKWHNHNNIELIEDKMPTDKEKIKDLKKIVDLQEQSIELLKEKISSLNASIHELKDTPFRVKTDFGKSLRIDYDYKMDFKKGTVEVKYKNISNFKLLTQKLGYSKSELTKIFGIDIFFEYADHPIHQLRNKKDTDAMISKAKEMMSNISTTDNMVAKYELEIPIIYLTKNNKSAYTINSYIINTEKNSGTCKLSFIDSE